MGRKIVRCEHCNTPIMKIAGTQVWRHYKLRAGKYKGDWFYGCHYYDSTINPAGADPYIQAEPKKEVPFNAESTK